MMAKLARSAIFFSWMFGAILGGQACAQGATAPPGYPTKPVRMIVPFPPGGGVDAVARILARRLSETLGQNVVLDNRGGSGGTIGAGLAAASTGDGYTLLFGGSATHGITPHLYRKLPYDPVRDFVPIVLVGAAPYILVVHPSVPARAVKELIALAKSSPGKLNYASAGSGSTLHLTGELFKTMAGVDIVHVPYKGSAPALTDLLAGRVQMTFNPAAVVLPHIHSGKLRALGVTSAKRTGLAPGIPTISEAGIPEFEAAGWYGVLGPAGTPPGIVTRLNREIGKLLEQKDFRERLTAVGVEPAGGSPAQFASYISSELAKWGKVVRASGARID
ncbi:MAG: tripartite tricarboxylate transporter substrate binding protein [Betaproteobacteria bacterium]|nr:tripartite tricarboxylate transporter substrate binding protein [Betaproteobacteria bacterium]